MDIDCISHPALTRTSVIRPTSNLLRFPPLGRCGGQETEPSGCICSALPCPRPPCSRTYCCSFYTPFLAFLQAPLYSPHAGGSWSHREAQEVHNQPSARRCGSNSAQNCTWDPCPLLEKNNSQVTPEFPNEHPKKREPVGYFGEDVAVKLGKPHTGNPCVEASVLLAQATLPEDPTVAKPGLLGLNQMLT